MNCGKLVIQSNTISDYSTFDFGISVANGLTPNLWGGVPINLSNGKNGIIFENLNTGAYRWYVRLKNTTNIVSQGIKQVNCNSDCACEKFTKSGILNSVFVKVLFSEHKMKKISGIACYDLDNVYTFATPIIPEDSSFIEISFLIPFSGRIEIF